MTKTYSNTKERTFTHLTEIERGQIAAYIDEGLSLREIGRRMERNVSTISRELERGKVQQIDTFRKPYTKYFPDAGARVYEDNRKNCGAHSTVMEAWEFIEFAEKKIKEENWSPDADSINSHASITVEWAPQFLRLSSYTRDGSMGIYRVC